MNHILFRLLCFITTLSSSILTIAAREPSVSGIKDESKLNIQYNFLLSGIQSAREALQSGIVKIDLSVTTSAGHKTAKHALYAVDFNLDKIRIDGYEGDMRTTYLRTPDYSATANFIKDELASGVIAKSEPNKLPHRRVSYFDLRHIGLVSAPQLFSDKYFGVDLERLVQMLSKQDVQQIQELEEGKYLVTSYVKQLALERSMVIDSKHGFTISQLILRYIPGVSPPTVIHKCDIEWKEKNQVWVPTYLSDTGRSGTKNEIALDWIQVNEPVPEKMFSIDDFKVPGYVMIIDKRVEPPLIEKIVRVEVPTEELTSENTLAHQWFFLLNVVIVIVLIVLVAVRYMRSKHNPA